MFVAIFTYMISFHALGKVHIYARSQRNKKITAKEMLKILDRQSSEIEDLTFIIMRKYDFETTLYFDSFHIKKLHCTLQALLSFKSVLDDFNMHLARLSKKTNTSQTTLSASIPRLEIIRETRSLI